MMSYEIFGGHWCAQCKILLARLKAAGKEHMVEYRDVEYPHNEDALKSRGVRFLPACFINGQEVSPEEFYEAVTK